MSQSHQHAYALDGPWQVGVVILGAGHGDRLGHGPKALIEQGGKPLLLHVLDAVSANGRVSAIAVTAPAGIVDIFDRVVAEAEPRVPVTVVPGGETRQASASQGLASLPDGLEWIAVTDVARPFTPHGIIDRLLTNLRNTARCSAGAPRPCGVVPTLPLVDSVHLMGDPPLLAGPFDRAALRAAQTPQVFYRECLAGAYQRAMTQGGQHTDEAGLVSQFGAIVIAAPGDWGNFKITYPHDLIQARAVLPRITVTRNYDEDLA